MEEEIHYKLLKLIEQNPQMSQRELAKKLGVSLGKANYCLKALMDKGLVKATNFKNNPNKSGYIYLLTPTGVKAKATAAIKFLKRKQVEYEQLKKEIEQLEQELATNEEIGK